MFRFTLPSTRAGQLNCPHSGADGRVFSHMTDRHRQHRRPKGQPASPRSRRSTSSATSTSSCSASGAPWPRQRQQLGALAPDERRTVGQALNDARATLQSALDASGPSSSRERASEQLEVERLDLTEYTHQGRRYGHKHLVTQAWERLENVFIGLGFEIAEGPEAEDDWHNFGALNFPPDHPARDMYDTLYLDYGEPGSTLLRTHTSPVQIRVMQETAAADLHGHARTRLPPGHRRCDAHARVPPDRRPGDRQGHHVRPPRRHDRRVQQGVLRW